MTIKDGMEDSAMGDDDRHDHDSQRASAHPARTPEQEREEVVAEIMRKHPGLTREKAEAQIDANW
jgi:hypothetical protein